MQNQEAHQRSLWKSLMTYLAGVPHRKAGRSRLSMHRWQSFIHSKTTRSGWKMTRRWRKQQRVSGSMGCLWGIARPREGGGYEIIAGHRRRRGSELAGKSEMPVIVRNYTDDEATIIMVDSNIQREDILPSEKAKAYKMKYEAMKHQGKKSGKNTLDEVGEAAGENAKKVQRYIWLSRLSDELLVMVDNKKLGFSQGVDISFLTEEAQQWVQAVMEEKGCNISMVQSAKIKEYGKTGELTLAMVRLILTEEKPKERKVTLKADKISEYFAEDCSSEEIEGIIIQLLDEWKKKQ